MERAYFFNSIDGDRKYKAGDLTRFFGALVNDGILPNPSTNLQVVVGEGMSVIVKAGFMWINSGHLYWNDNDLIVPIANASGDLNRIDRIVVRWMNTERDIRAYAVSGELASNPTAPAVQRDADYFEMCLGDVAVNEGTTQIIQAHITDQRLSTALCGVASATYNQIDTEAFNAQLQSWYETFTADALTTFTAWFDMLQDVLEGDAAGNLLGLINQRTVAPETSTLGGIAKYIDETGKNLGEAVPRQDYALPPDTITATLTVAGWSSGASISGSSPSIDLSGGTDHTLQISVDGDAAEEITLTLSNCDSGANIATELQTQIQDLGGNKEDVTVQYLDGVYVIKSPTNTAVSAVIITNGTTANVADDLRLGIANGGTETLGGEQMIADAAIYSADAPGDILVAQSATKTEFEAWTYAGIQVIGQAVGSMIIRANWDIPTINVPVVVEVR